MKAKTYILHGSPVPLARARIANRRMWDSQKELKLVCGIQLAQQHLDHPLFCGPLELDVTFYMPIPQSSARKRLDGSHCFFKPDLDNLIKFIADVGNGILYKDDACIALIKAKKVYDELPRTVFILRELDEENNQK